MGEQTLSLRWAHLAHCRAGLPLHPVCVCACIVLAVGRDEGEEKNWGRKIGLLAQKRPYLGTQNHMETNMEKTGDPAFCLKKASGSGKCERGERKTAGMKSFGKKMAWFSDPGHSRARTATTPAHARTHTHARTHARTHTHTHTRARTHARTQTYTRTRTHAPTHAYTHTPTRTHTDTPTHLASVAWGKPSHRGTHHRDHHRAAVRGLPLSRLLPALASFPCVR